MLPSRQQFPLTMRLCVKTLINHITHPAAAAGSRRCLWSVLQDWLQELFLAKPALPLEMGRLGGHGRFPVIRVRWSNRCNQRLTPSKADARQLPRRSDPKSAKNLRLVLFRLPTYTKYSQWHLVRGRNWPSPQHSGNPVAVQIGWFDTGCLLHASPCVVLQPR